jgi:hypothetical protein
MTRIAKALIAFSIVLSAVGLFVPFGKLDDVVQGAFVVSDAPLTQAESGEDVIVIKVPAEDLQRCINTLDQVFLGPVTDASVQSVSLSADQSGPIVRCEAEG